MSAECGRLVHSCLSKDRQGRQQMGCNGLEVRVFVRKVGDLSCVLLKLCQRAGTEGDTELLSAAEKVAVLCMVGREINVPGE